MQTWVQVWMWYVLRRKNVLLCIHGDIRRDNKRLTPVYTQSMHTHDHYTYVLNIPHADVSGGEG